MFYGSLEWETSFAELRPAIGVEVVTITVETTAALRMLDFTRMTRAYKFLSYFQPDFTEQAARFAFLRRLGTLISRPVVPGHESEYLITQTMMEYLAHEHMQPFDGVLFASAQRNAGTNLVLFAKMNDGKPTFPVNYQEKSIAVHETVHIEYEHVERRYCQTEDGVEPDWIFWEDPD